MEIIYPNAIGTNLLDGVIIAYLKIFTVNSIVVMISLFMIVCLPENCETILSSLLTCECSKNLLQFMHAEKNLSFHLDLVGCLDARTAFVRTRRGWECAALPGAVGYMGEGDGGDGARLFWEVQSGQMRVNRHKLPQ